MQIYCDGHNFVTDADHIPGRNYLSGTAPVSVQGQNIVGQAITTYALTDKSLSNQAVTFNMTMTSDTTSGRLFVGSEPNWQVYTYYDIQKGINKIKFTTKLNSDVDAITIKIDNSTANIVIQDVTLNKGNFAREYSPAPEDIARKSDLTTKTIIQRVDINTLTEEGDFFVESGNLDHFPAGYRNQWYFLNVINPANVNRIKQTVMPDNSDSMSWTMTRAGSYNTDTHIVEWGSWLISDFANGKLLKSK